MKRDLRIIRAEHRPGWMPVVGFMVLICFLLMGSNAEIRAQEKVTITGHVVDRLTGEPLPGISILEKGTGNGTITGVDGNYTITVNRGATLLFSFVGMKTKVMKTDGLTAIDLEMEEDIIGLEEVVAIGYGSVKKSDLTGAVGSVDVEEIMKNPVTSLDQSLQGRVAGVQVVQLSAQPGGTALFRVRGGNSIYAGNEPLYVIDGMQVNSNENLSWLSAPTINALSSLNPSDIESVEILKDASATSIYGAKGANGVVLITTKRGKAGSDKIRFEAYYGMQKMTRRIEVMNATDYAILFDEAGRNAAEDNGMAYTPSYPDPESLGEGTDWQDMIYRTAPTQNYQLSFSGGNERTRYAISTNFYDQKGIIIGSDFRRYSFRTNIDHQVKERLNVGTSFTANKTLAHTVGSATQAGFFPGVVNTALTFSPVLPVRDSTGQYTIRDPEADAWLDNPVAVTREVTSIDNTFKLVGNLYANYTIMKGLKLNVSLGIDRYQNTQDYYNPSITYSGSFNGGQARYSPTEFNTLLNENTLNYSREFGKHRLDLLGGFTYQKRDSRTFAEIVTGFPNDRLEHYGIAIAEDFPSIYTGFSEEALISYLGRINYSFSDRYLATVTHRIDGSSKFGPNNRFGHFPSIALAWRLSSEPFMENIESVYSMKLRASLGTSGNDAIPNYLFIPTMTTGNYAFNNTGPVTGYYQAVTGNDDLKWETTRQLDIGMDLAFFSGRLSLVADYYNKYTYDMLYYAEVPYISGFSNAMVNVGSMVNNGMEFTLNTVNFTGAFNWNTDFSISFNKSRVTDLNNNNATYISDDTYKLKIGYWSIIDVGEEIGSFYGLESDGIWQLGEEETAALYGARPGDFKYVDQDGDFDIDNEDRKIIGHAQPDFFWSLNNTLSFKGIELSFYFQGVQGNDILNSNRFELESANGKSNASVALLDRWTPDNPSNLYPRANRNADYLRMSDRYLEDGSYVRLQLVTLAYDLPARLTRRLKMSQSRIYLSGKNLLTFTDYSGFDPEVGRFGTSNIRQGYDLGGYPSARTVLLGISIEF
ncbi:MAG: TonB-dependent receptor [Bacteroidales bacterium]|nr:TonB-dependent receptor [Bacteroidales bacterium]